MGESELYYETGDEIQDHVCSRYVARMQRMLEGDHDIKVPDRCVPCFGESYTCKPYLLEREAFLRANGNGNGGNGKGKKTIDDRAVLLSMELPQEPVTAERGAQDGA